MNVVWLLVALHFFIIGMLLLDFGVFRRQAHAISVREAAVWSCVWISLAMGFAAGIWQFWDYFFPHDAGNGSTKAIEFVTGYIVELSLSVDNLFVFLVIFRYFAVPDALRHRVLFWGILGAVIMRATFILVGAALLHYLHWMIYVFGAFLIYTGYKLLLAGEEEVDPSKNPLLRLVRRYFPVIDNYDSPAFFIFRDGRWFATPLPLVLVVVESTDVIFALDSIPAIFGITRDIFIVYTSNIFAVLGLRALFFLLSGVLELFAYLKYGLACVLAFVGVKMLAQEPLEGVLHDYGMGQQQLTLGSLGVIALILGFTIILSMLWAKPRQQELEWKTTCEEKSESV
ncbi:MAG: membrane protein [Gemmatales bacterium]|nr:MAG: membrane protein [Gemmatales bacterium]